MNSAKDNILKHIEREDVVIVAVSGGKDSICLLHLLKKLSLSLGFTIVAAHFNHCLRGKESDLDAEFVKGFCAKNSIDFCQERWTEGESLRSKGVGVELKARNARYGYLTRIKKERVAKLIITAHHALDQAETIMLHLMRGSGLGGAKGMEILSADGLFRPLLTTTMEEIDAYVAQNALEYVVDSSNFGNDYDRNYMRNVVFPALSARFNVLKLNDFGALAALDNEYIEKNCPSPLIKEGKAVLIVDYLKSDYALASRYVRLAIEGAAGDIKDISKKNVDAVLGLACLTSGKKVDLPKGLLARREFDRVIIEPSKQSDLPKGLLARREGNSAVIKKNRQGCVGESLPFNGEGLYRLGEALIEVRRVQPPSIQAMKECAPSVLYADCDSLKGATLRFRREGDLFKPIGGGRRKLKQHFIDRKIALSKRNLLPLLAKENTVLLLFGHEVSNEAKIASQTKEAYRFEIKSNLV